MRFSQRPFFPRFLSVIIFAASVFFIGSDLHAQDFYLHNGDRVTFYGDSITAQRYYTRDIQDFVETRYPTLQVTFTTPESPATKSAEATLAMPRFA